MWILENTANWWQNFKNTVDDLILRSNVTSVEFNPSWWEKNRKKSEELYSNMETASKIPKTDIWEDWGNPKTGALNMKRWKVGSTLWLNVTFLLRCNSDVPVYLSGTASRPLLLTYQTMSPKPGLKTYIIFDTIRSVLLRVLKMLVVHTKRKDKARSLLTKIVNALTDKLEMVSMASLYLLGNPDITLTDFVVFYWKVM